MPCVTVRKLTAWNALNKRYIATVGHEDTGIDRPDCGEADNSLFTIFSMPKPRLLINEVSKLIQVKNLSATGRAN